MAHYIAVFVRVEILYGQILHLIEHRATEFVKKSLRDYRHKLGINGAGDKGQSVHSDKEKHKGKHLFRRVRPR